VKPESRVDMPRLFIAIDFPEYVSAKLQDIAYGMPGAVWVPSHQYHLTLRFLGEQNESTLEYVRHALNDVHVDSFHIDLKGVGHFPLRGDPEVLWVGVAANEALLRLSRKLESALGRAGVQPDGRKFHPHVTLARLKNDALRYVGNFEVHHALFKIEEIPVESFNLYSSRLTPDGAIHTVEADYRLEGILQGEHEGLPN
jgi:2'-5' RNA ligase